MLLSKFFGDHYKCVENSGEILVHPKITRIVGQNEAGKTALLELLNVLRPITGTLLFALEDYPRRKLTQYKKVHSESPHTPVRAEFILNEDDVSEIEEEFGKGALETPTLTLSKPYGSKTCYYTLKVNEASFIKHFLSQMEIEEDTKAVLRKTKTLNDFRAEVGKLSKETQAQFKDLPSDLKNEIFNTMSVPYFFYFDEYATLPGEISLKKLKRFTDDEENYKDDDADSMRTAKALIDFAGSEVDEFLNKDNHERLTADLEAASNEITDQLRRFWTSNQNLEISFELETKVNAQNVMTDTILHVRVYNTKHRVTVAFEKRSKGFVWFFSFLVAFSAYKERDEKIVLLLDEPGLNLGAVAQRDLMRYFEEVLSPHHQVIYTTHSPFMIDVKQLDSVRTVEDEEIRGTVVSNDPYKHSPATRFPLQAALGYDLSQTLFVAPNNLLVEGPADMIYLNLASEILRAEKKLHLTEAWTIVPVGGADKIASFVSLLGAQGLNLAVFMDVAPGDHQRFRTILENKLMLKKNLITVGSILGEDEADVEDLFTQTAYLKLVNQSYKHELKGKNITVADLTDPSPRIVKKLETYFEEKGLNNGKFNHYKPAYDLMMNPTWLPGLFDNQSKENFGKAITALNEALNNAEENDNAGLPARKLKGKSRPADLTT